MPISGYFDKAFGVDGDLTAVPDAVQVDGSVSYDQGYPIAYSTPIASGGLNIERAKMNQLFFDITSAIQQLQQNSVPPFITTAMNGGTPYSYNKNVRVVLTGVVYQSLANANTDTPPSSNWAIADIGATNVYTAGTTTGSANAQVAGTTTPAATSFITGQAVICTAGFSNTTAATFGAGGETPVAIKKNSGSGLIPLVGGEIIAGDTLFMVKNTAGTCWVLEAGLPIGSAAYKSLTDFLQSANNLSDLANLGTALVNLTFGGNGTTYLKIPNSSNTARPWIIQCGTGTTGGGGGGSITFPVTFPNAVLSVNVNAQNNAVSTAAATSITTSGCSVTTWNGPTGTSLTYNYITVGY